MEGVVSLSRFFIAIHRLLQVRKPAIASYTDVI